MRRTVSSVNAPSKKRMSGPMAVEALLSLALESSSAERPSTSRRLTSLPSVAATMPPVLLTSSTTSGSGLFQLEIGMQARLHAVADGRHRLRLGEDLRVRADADLQVLRPGALLDQHALELGGLLAAGHQLGEIAAELGLHAGADRLGLLWRAPRLLLDHPLQHREGKRHPRRLDGLQVDRRQQPRLLRIALRLRRVGEDVRERADPLALARAQHRHRIAGLRQVAHRRRQPGDVPDAVAAHRHDRRAADLGPPTRPAKAPAVPSLR